MSSDAGATSRRADENAGPHGVGSNIVAIGEPERVRGFAFAGVQVAATEDPQAVRVAWRALAPEAALVILTPAAHAALQAELEAREQPLCAVMAP